MKLRNNVIGIMALTVVAACAGGSAALPTDDEPPAAVPPGTDGDPGPSGSFGDSTQPAPGGGEQCAASVAKTEKPKLDVIIAIDTSASMLDEMVQIRKNLNAFAKKFVNVGLDYRVLLLTKRATSPSETGTVICVPPPLGGANCADNLPMFVHFDTGIANGMTLRAILQLYETGWGKHVRFDSTKVFIGVTDDDTYGTGADFDAALLAKEPAGMFGTTQARKYIFHGIASKPAGEPMPSAKVCSTATGDSLTYQQLAMLTGGTIGEVCKTDYSGVLDSIATQVVERLTCDLAYPTSEASDPTKLVVQYTPAGGTAQNLEQVTDPTKCAAVPNGWYYDDNAKPTRIIMCKALCTEAKANVGSQFAALVGCKAPPPR